MFKSSLNLNTIRHWSENWCPGYLEHALCSSEIHLAAAKSLEIIGHVTNCCKRPIGGTSAIMDFFNPQLFKFTKFHDINAESVAFLVK